MVLVKKVSSTRNNPGQVYKDDIRTRRLFRELSFIMVVKAKEPAKDKLKVARKASVKGKEPALPPVDPIDTDDLSESFRVHLQLDDPRPAKTTESVASGAKEHVFPRTMYRITQPFGPQQVLNRAVPASGSVKQGYFSLLQDFRNGYPDTTDIHCWWCCHQFEGKPIGIPKKAHGDNQECSQSIGCFCSFACACAYTMNDKNLSSSLTLLNSLYRSVMKTVKGGTSANTQRITPAPPRETLKKFGGQMTISEYRQASECGQPWRLLEAPMMPWPMFAEEIMIKQSNSSYTRNGMQRTLEIRKSTELDSRSNALKISSIPSFRGSSSLAPSSRRTAIDQLISFA